MFRWIIVLLVVLGIVALFTLPQRAPHSSYVNGLPPYTHLPGREYILQRDCYIFKFKDAASDWPLIGAHATVPALPEAVDPKLVGTDLPSVRLLGVARVGAHLKIVSVRRDQRAGDVKITFELLFTDEAERPYPRVDGSWIMNHPPEASGEAPSILPDYAAPRLDR